MTTTTTGGKQQHGFTLIELMIVISIVAILLAVALPAYQNQVMRGHRAAAQSQMLDIANREQQYLLSNRAYIDHTAMAGTGFTLETRVSDHYTYAIVVGTGTVPTYTITFTATGKQAKDGNLSLNSEGVKLPSEKW